MHRESKTHARGSARLSIAALSLGLLILALLLGAGRAPAASEGRPAAELRRHPDRRPDPGTALRQLQPGRRQPDRSDAEHAGADRQPRGHLQPLLHALLALRALAGGAADRPLRPQQQRARERVPQRRLPGLQQPRRRPAQRRDLAAGRRLPDDPRRQVPQRLRRKALLEAQPKSHRDGAPGKSILNSDSDHYYYGYELNDNGVVEGPFGDSGSWETREYGERDDFGCPLAPLNGKPCNLPDRRPQSRLPRTTSGSRRKASPSTSRSTTALPTATSADRPVPSRRPATTTCSTGHRFRHKPSEGFNEGNVNDKPRFIREAPYLSPSEIHTYRVYYDKALESLKAVDDGVKTDHRHPRRDAPAAQHLHHLHLRQRLLLWPASARRREVPRLRALDPPAAADAGAGDQGRHGKRSS